MLKPSFLITLFFHLATLVYAQKHCIDSTIVDSTTFVNSRSILEKSKTERFQKRIFQSNDTIVPYRLLLPEYTKTGDKYPLVIALHNSGRVGTDNEKQLEHLTRIWLRDEIYPNYNAFVLAPQFSSRSSQYSDFQGTIVSKPSESVYTVLHLIKDIATEFPQIDKNRIYLVGYSMGASTAHNLMNLEPDYFAAMVSIAGVPDFSDSDKLKSKPIWLIHGEKDITNPYHAAYRYFLKLRGNENLIFTDYVNLDHTNITIPFLLSDKIPKWLFQQQKSVLK